MTDLEAGEGGRERECGEEEVARRWMCRWSTGREEEESKEMRSWQVFLVIHGRTIVFIA